MTMGFPLIRDLVLQFKEFISGKSIYAYNAPFDERFLKNQMGISIIAIDIMKLTKEKKPGLPSYKLVEVGKKYGMENIAHTSLGDALMCYHLVNILKI